MDKAKLEAEAEKIFPLPKKEDFIYGEAFLIQSAIVLEKRKLWIAGAMYVLENR